MSVKTPTVGELTAARVEALRVADRGAALAAAAVWLARWPAKREEVLKTEEAVKLELQILADIESALMHGLDEAPRFPDNGVYGYEQQGDLIYMPGSQAVDGLAGELPLLLKPYKEELEAAARLFAGEAE